MPDFDSSFSDKMNILTDDRAMCHGKKWRYLYDMLLLWNVRHGLQILLLIFDEHKQINFYSHWNYQKFYAFIRISGGTEVN